MPDPTLQQSTRLSVTVPPRESGWFNSCIPFYGLSVTSRDTSRINPEAAFTQLTALNPAYAQNLNRDTFVALIRDGKIGEVRTSLQSAGVLSSHIDQFIGSSSSTSPTGLHQYQREITIANRHSNMSTGATIGGVVGTAVGIGVGIKYGTTIGAAIGSVIPGAGTVVGAVVGCVVGAAVGGLIGWFCSR